MTQFEAVQNKLWTIIENDHDDLYYIQYIAPDHIAKITDWCDQIRDCSKIEDEENKLGRDQAVGVVKHAMCWALEVKVRRLANYIANDVHRLGMFL